MRVDLEALRQALAAKTSLNLSTLFAGGGVVLATLVLVYGVLHDVVADDTGEAVTVSAESGPLFKPIAATAAPQPSEATRPKIQTGSLSDGMLLDDDASVTRAVQTGLKRAGCYVGPVNGRWSASTRSAMAEFTTRVNAQLPVEKPDPVLLALVETHSDVSCLPDGERAADEPRQESNKDRYAKAESGTATDARAMPATAAMSDHRAAAGQGPLDAVDLGYSYRERSAPNPIASVQAASNESDDDDGAGVGEAAAVTAAGAAAGAAAHEATKEKPRRTSSRKYRKNNSFGRQVSKGFRQIQRSLNKLF